MLDLLNFNGKKEALANLVNQAIARFHICLVQELELFQNQNQLAYKLLCNI